jgi:hypothetical protein
MEGYSALLLQPPDRMRGPLPRLALSSVLSMNVAGLPEILNGNGESGDKTIHTKLIGQVSYCRQLAFLRALTLAQFFTKYNYEAIHVQEMCALKIINQQ